MQIKFENPIKLTKLPVNNYFKIHHTCFRVQYLVGVQMPGDGLEMKEHPLITDFTSERNWNYSSTDHF